ncbi:hypothetical protein [Actinoplanes aureus]|uniref:Galactose oxidase n=1 Tax=Actinoplanes aureus TaxID=2792083 RepID=A0A931CFS4_9ACTN|nr:hypothetical protein [Actinoplanes aureus]MBG0566421.1 hypothetical protein [Actinoplanes aureus]
MRRGATAVLVAGLWGVLAGCGPNVEPVAQSPSGWSALPASPLSPREAALGLWTGREVLFLGGSDAPPCPPSADCPGDSTPLADGAAFDPATNRWREIADSPVPLMYGQGVVLGSAAYILPDAAGEELLVYRVDHDEWTRVPVPIDGDYRLLAAGDRLVAYLGSEENRQGKDYLFDPRTATWAALPADPLSAAYERTMAWTGSELVLFDHELVANPGAEKPSITRAAALDLTAGSWRRLPDSAILATAPWLTAGDQLINPMLGGADGGQIGNWGRTYPYGGSVAPATGVWSALPNPPAGDPPAAGARTATTAIYLGDRGVVLDTTTGAWQTVPAVPGGQVTGRTVVAAGTRMVVFGGARSDGTPAVIGDAWIWTP